MAATPQSISATTPNEISPADDDRLRQAAELLLAARRDRTPITELPQALRPKTPQEAFHLQNLIAETLGPIGGWKVGAPSFDSPPRCAPLPLRGGFAPANSTILGTYSRLRGVEAEIAFLIGRDLPPRATPYSRDEVVSAVASAHPAIEILESAFDDPEAADALSVLGDLSMNGGFAYGPALTHWQSVDLSQESVTVIVDGVVRAEATASNPAGTDLIRLIAWLANEGQSRTGGLRAGDWVTTGSWTGNTVARASSEVIVRFSSFGEIRIYFAA